MPFKYDTKGVQEAGSFAPIPEDDYYLKIEKVEERKSQKGHPQANVTLIVNEGEHKGRKVWNTITFMPKDLPGAGMAKHWLHAIGQPYEGVITVDTRDWRGVIKAHVVIEEYDGKKKNAIKEIFIPEETESAGADEKGSETKEDVPF